MVVGVAFHERIDSYANNPSYRSARAEVKARASDVLLIGLLFDRWRLT